jgi:nitrate/TMAO reductase-like tetraheme cytochrome c subunit
MKRAVQVLVVLLALAGGGTIAAGQTVQCEGCHGSTAFLEGKRPTPAGDSALFVTDSLVGPSVHGDLGCASCHPMHAEGYPHRAEARARPCTECHAGAGQAWDRSIHAANVAEGGPAAGCVDCHGSHRVLPAEDRSSATHALNVAETCARCHADPDILGEYFATPERAPARRAVSQYYQTVHGTAITESGLVVAATCNDCHRAHDILPSEDSRSSVNRSQIPETCGACHVGIQEVFETSAHGQDLAAAGGGAPVCTDCHTSHEIVESDEPTWFLGVVEECGACHEDLYESYLQSYHGKVTRLGSGLAAQCSECHTAHAMLPASDPRSSVSPDRLVETCAQCHPRANENFIQFYSHGDHADRGGYPVLFWTWLFMTTLLVGVMSFFGTHTLLWLGRLGVDALRLRRGKGRKGEGP